jgi:hypothetical protein
MVDLRIAISAKSALILSSSDLLFAEASRFIKASLPSYEELV